ncbi:ribosomal protein bL12 [Nannocystis bainbridge]|uniref:Ribosomal protein L7/L12 n=1 Tax=Nannocystis bainbridge TaxID=2995303 RepID=A0ABT5E8V0_9BACT|nr:ribosomal protein L7/L12 [Nannocystis bainbridge]
MEIRGQALDEDEDDDLTPIDVVLNDCGPQKIMVIKLIREVTGLGLKESKDMSETAGAVVRSGLPRSEASALAQQLVALGAAVELREAERGVAAEVDLFLQVCGPNKISVIKEVRAITGLGLKEAKDLVEAAPTLIKAAVAREAAMAHQELLHAVGATVELR